MNKLSLILIVSILVLFGGIARYALARTSEWKGVVQFIVADAPSVIGKNGESSFRAGDKSTNFFFLQTADRAWIPLEDNSQWMKFAQERREVQIAGEVRNGVLTASTVKYVNPDFVRVATPTRTEGNWMINIVPVTINFGTGNSKTSSDFISIEEAKNPIFFANNSSRAFFLQNSNPSGDPNASKLWLKGKDTPDGEFTPVTINATVPTDCDWDMLNAWTTAIDAELMLLNKHPDSYNSTVYVFDDMIYSQMGCTLRGLGSVGQPRTLTMGGRVWVPKSGLLYSPRQITHEIGHNLSLMHSHSTNGTTILEYGDQSCVMGGQYYRFNNYQLRRLGWFDGEFKQISLDTSGTYDLFSTIRHVKPRMSTLQFAFAPLSATEDIYPETRVHSMPFDDFSFLSLKSYVKGVTLRTGPIDFLAPNSYPTLIDATPETPTTGDAGLVLNSIVVNGRTFTNLRIGNPSWGTRLSISNP